MSKIQVKLLKWQGEVVKDNHRFKVICAGRRAGKSVLARMEILNWATTQPGNYYIVSPTYRQSHEIHWRDFFKEIPPDWIRRSNETELMIEIGNGSIISFKGGEDPDKLRGVKLRGLVIDEIASIRNWNWLWNEVLRATLIDYKAPAYFISTPKGYNSFYDLYQLGRTENKNYKSWRFTTYDNPKIPIEEIETAKKELTEDTFAQEYLADFRKFTGLAHPQWNRELHLISAFEIPRNWQAVRGFDYGSAHPTASVRGRIDLDGNMFIDSCYKDSQREIEEHARAILAQDYGLGHVQSWGDPSGTQWFTEFAKYNLHIVPAIKQTGQQKQGWVEYCVGKINQVLKTTPGHTVILPDRTIINHAPKFFVFDLPVNQQFIHEIELLGWKETNTGQIVPVLDETNDPQGHFDLMAALRYLMVSYTQAERKVVQSTGELPANVGSPY